MRRLPILMLAAAALSPLPALAAPGFAVCVAIDGAGQGRLVHTAQPFPRDSAQVEGDAPAFARAAAAAGVTGAPVPACHWEPTREKADDYLRRLKQGSGARATDAQPVSFSPGG